MLARTLILKTSSWGPVERIVRGSRLFKPLVRRFIAGDTLEEALPAARNLLDRGFKVSLDLLGENTKSEEEAVNAKCHYIESLKRIRELEGDRDVDEPHRIESANLSIKLTQCGLDLGDDFAERQYREVVWTAAELHGFVRVDMEGSPYTERTLALVEKVWKELPNTGTVLQSYLHRTGADIDRIIELGMRVRLVKGAYLEPKEVAIQDKRGVDAAFLSQAKKLMSEAHYPAIATHDEKIVKQLLAYATAQGIDRSRFEFQMLYGIRRDLQNRLLEDGYNVRVYIPFGQEWYPYFSRRLAERPANVFFILKALLKG